ncbi:hypothetical protein J4Q44_G00023900, partial [Coregonus suidteri]
MQLLVTGDPYVRVKNTFSLFSFIKGGDTSERGRDSSETTWEKLEKERRKREVETGKRERECKQQQTSEIKP